MRIEYVVETDSTNAELLARPIGVSVAEPTLLVARHQRAGRGRRGRPWASRPEASLTLSVALERRVGPGAPSLAGLSLASGVAIAECLRGFGVEAQLKWPNDLMRDGAKLGGILVEVRRAGVVERAVIGVGLNLAPDPDIAASAAQPVATLFETACGEPHRREIAAAIGAALVAAFERFKSGGLAACAEGWARLDMLRDRAVTVIEADGSSWSGHACGIDAEGRLLVRAARGALRPVLAGEVSVRALP